MPFLKYKDEGIFISIDSFFSNFCACHWSGGEEDEMNYDDMSNTRLQRTDSNVNSTNIMAISVLLTCSKVQQQQKQKFRQKWIWNPPAVHLKIDYVNLFLKKKALLSQNILSYAFRQTRCLSVKLQAWTSALRFFWKHPLLNVLRVLCYFQ